jgi:hypothetical protein
MAAITMVINASRIDAARTRNPIVKGHTPNLVPSAATGISTQAAIANFIDRVERQVLSLIASLFKFIECTLQYSGAVAGIKIKIESY